MTKTPDGILIEQNRLLYSNSMMPITVSVVASLLLSGSVWSLVDHTVIVLWSSLFLIFSLIRLRLLFLFNSHQSVLGNQRLWHLRFLIGNYTIAILWGASSFLLFPGQNLSHQIVFILIIIGIAAGGVASLCSSFSILIGYLSLVLFPLAFKLLLMGSAENIFKSMLLILFWAVVVAGGKKISLNIRENIQLRLQSIERETILKINEGRYRHIFINAPLGIFHYKENGTIIDCNEEFVRILGSSKEALIGFNMLTMLQDDMLLRALKESLESGEGYYEGDYTSVTSKNVTPIRAFFKKIKHSEQKELGGICIVEDFTEKRKSEDLIRYHASYDTLTELPNRRLLLEYLENEISRAKRHSHYGALLYLDLDNFKTINDSLGHSVGDQLLKIVAKRLREYIRKEDIASRMGGDEFTIVFTKLDKDMHIAASKVNALAQELSLCLSSPCQIQGRNLQTTVSIGISMFPKADKDVGDILKQADTAMYRAKAAGRNKLRFFLPNMQDDADQKLQISTELLQAIQKEELVIYFQPQVDITGLIVGAEALVRWQHPEKGLMAPGLFLPIAEEAGLIQNIDRWVLQEACHKIKHWTDTNQLQQSQIISVNVSGKEIAATDFVSSVTQILDRTGANPKHLGIEITEGSLISTGKDIVTKILEIRHLGVKFSIDDFGTGYSSLSYLQSLPINTLKIDRSFINDIKGANHKVILVDTIIMMAKNLGLDVIAEGVETESEISYLSERGCNTYQGFYFSKPVPEEAFLQILKSGII